MISTRLGVRGQRGFTPSSELAMGFWLVAAFVAPDVSLAHEPGDPLDEIDSSDPSQIAEKPHLREQRDIDILGVPDNSRTKGSIANYPGD